MFDFSQTMLSLIEDISIFSPQLNHVKTSSILVGLSQARSSRRFGLYAKIIPLRFKEGGRFLTKGSRTYEVAPIWANGYEILYLVYFVLPRFQNLSFQEKMTTIFHELYHISPKFNGDIRRFPGSRYAHTGRKENFNTVSRKMAEAYLDKTPHLELTEFLKHNFKGLERQYGQVVGRKVPIPKLKVVRPETLLEPNGQFVFAM